MTNNIRMAMLAVAVVAASCASMSPMLPANMPEKLKVDTNETITMVVPAKGVQIYECRAKKDATGYEWAFVAPEADLFDVHGNRIGRHYAGPHWEAADGSRFVGALKERADAPVAGTIQWLKLSARSAGPHGTFSKVSGVLRVNTTGGAAPRDGCSQAAVGAAARVAYTADYFFLAAR